MQTLAPEKAIDLETLTNEAKLKKALGKIERQRWDLLTGKEISLIEGQKTGAKSGAERQRDFKRKEATIFRRPCADPARRKSLERSPAKWLKYYLVESYPMPFGKVHYDIIKAAMRTIKSGAGMVCAAPRGTGKTTVLQGVALYAVLTGRSKYPLIGAWKKSATRATMAKWLTALSDNPRISEDYPEYCQPFEMSTHANRLRGLAWEDNKDCGADVLQSDGVIILPAGLGAIGSFSINGSVRGLNATLADGSTIRPDLVLLDDPQDKKTARSATLTRQVMETIEGDILSLSGPDNRLAIMAAVTVIVPDDVSEQLLNSPEYEAVRVSQIVTWPDGWEDTKSETRVLWGEWNMARMAGLDEHDNGLAARKFYRANKATLTAGVKTSWRYRYDKERKDPDAIYAAFYDFFRLGPAAFAAERQNAPERPETATYTLTAPQVLNHMAAAPRYEVPLDAKVLTAFSDINRSGLHWAVAAFDQLFGATVVAYGCHPEKGDLWEENAPELTRKKAIYAGLQQLAKKIEAMPFSRGGQPVKPSILLIDRGYEPDTVNRFCEVAAYPFTVFPSRGYAAQKYFVRKTTLVGKPFEQAHITDSRGGQFCNHNADYWREITQRGFLGPAGAPGAAMIHGPDAKRHQQFADQITAERLKNKYATDAGMRWEWGTFKGRHNDWLDALVGCYVAAAWAGLTTAGEFVKKPKRKARRETRKAKVGIS